MKKNKHNTLSELLSLLSKGQLVALVAAGIAIVALIWWVQNSTYIDVGEREELRLTPTQIKSVEDIGEWEFLSITDEELVDTVRYGFLSDDKLVRIYYGKLRIGLNMHELKHGWATVRGDTLVARLPEVKLLDAHFIDEARTRSFYEEGKWSHRDREHLYQKAEQQMLARCLTRKNLDEARANARQQMEQLFRAMGFQQMEILFEDEERGKETVKE